jgi:hypothetical protein
MFNYQNDYIKFVKIQKSLTLYK